MLGATLVSLSQNQSLRKFSESTRAGRRLSGRFVAGSSVADALSVARTMNEAGITLTLDCLGESVRRPIEAEQSAAVYHELLEQVSQQGLRANVSVKLSQMGCDVNRALCQRLVEGICRHAALLGNFVRIDMEGSAHTQFTIDLTRDLHSKPEIGRAVGVVIQAYLFRSEKDIEELVRDGISVRLCKGAYREPASIAFPKKEDVDDNYIHLMKLLLKSGTYHGIATHDEKMIDATIAFAKAESIPSSAFEFQMLYGIRRDLQRSLVANGFNVRVYTPFGTEWYPYFMRRLAERPANLLFVVRNLL